MSQRTRHAIFFGREDQSMQSATMSFGIDEHGNIEPVFMFASSLAEFWEEHAEEIESGEKRVLCHLELVDAKDDGSEVTGLTLEERDDNG